MVSGVCNGSNQIDISDFQDYQLPEGTMLDGAIMDEDALKDVLRIIIKKELVIVSWLLIVDKSCIRI